MGASRGSAPHSQALVARASALLSGERAFCNLQLRPQSGRMRPTFTAEPVATNGSPESRAKNRRVELRIAMAKQ